MARLSTFSFKTCTVKPGVVYIDSRVEIAEVEFIMAAAWWHGPVKHLERVGENQLRCRHSNVTHSIQIEGLVLWRHFTVICLHHVLVAVLPDTGLSLSMKLSHRQVDCQENQNTEFCFKL